MQQALEIVVGGLVQGSAFALVALGFALVFRVTGTINLAQGAFVVLGALLLHTFHQALRWPLALALLASLAVSIVVGIVVARTVFEPALRRLTLSGMVMLTGGLLTLFEGAMLLGWGSQPYQIEPFSGSEPFHLFGIRITTQAPWAAGACLVIVVATWWVLQKTTLGTALRACSENPSAATLMGIDVGRMTTLSYAAASAIGAIGGMAIGPIVSLQFDAGSSFTLSGFIAVTLGGIASFFGALIGGLGLGIVEQVAAGYISSLFSLTIALGLLMLTLVLRPQGLLSGRIRRREDVRDHEHNAIGVVACLTAGEARVAAALALAVVLLVPLAASGTGLLSSLTIAGISFLAILGLDVLMGYCGQVSLGHAAFMATGGYGAAIAVTRLGLPPLAGVLCGLALSLVSGALVAATTVRLRGHYLALATMAFGLLVDTLTIGLSNLTGGPSGLTGIPNFSLGAFTFSGPVANYYLVWGLVIAGLVLLGSAMRSGFGRTLRAIRTDQTAALALGIDVPRYKLYAFLIGAAFASIAGSLLAFDFQYLSPEMVDTQQSFLIVTMLVIGGEGSLVGPVIGVILLTLLPTVFQPLATYKTLASGILLVVALMYLPSGIYGGAIALLRRGRPLRARSFSAQTVSLPEGS